MSKGIALWRFDTLETEGLVHVDLDPAPQTLDEASSRLPGGAYTTFRTFERRRVMRLADHFDRLEETARLAGQPLLLNRRRLAQVLGEALQRFPHDLARVRISLDLEQNRGRLYILIEELHVPSAEEYERGVRAVTRTMHRNNPKAKLTGFIETASQIRQTLPKGINEALMISAEDQVLEGLSSNFFGVQNGVIWTAEQGVLSGITRSLVLEAIYELGLPMRLEGLPVDDLFTLDEAFITSASRGVLPVTEIDDRPIANGRPGPLTRQLEEVYARKVEERLEPVLETLL